MMEMAKCFRGLTPGTYAPPPLLLQRYTARTDITHCKRIDISAEAAAAPPTYEAVLAALESVDFPNNKSRKNTLKAEDDSQEGMCLGVVCAWRTAATGFAGGCAGGNGVICSCHAQGRPNLAVLLAAFARKWKPEFRFTSIQVNKVRRHEIAAIWVAFFSRYQRYGC